MTQIGTNQRLRSRKPRQAAQGGAPCAEEAARAAEALRRLSETIAAALPRTGHVNCAAAGLKLVRREEDARTAACVTDASVAIVAAGRKRAVVGGHEIEYGAGDVFLLGADLPDKFEAVGATASRPFLAASLALSAERVAAVRSRLAEIRGPKPLPLALSEDEGASACAVWCADAAMIDAFRRLAELADKPEDAAFLAPAVQDEILYRVLTGPHGADFARLYDARTAEGRVREAIQWIRQHYAGQFVMEEAAARASMSKPTFYRHFKAVTKMSPRQFVKRLRLYEARRLMTEEGRGASEAAAAVGYESPAYFSREFKRTFGQPPAEHAAMIRRSAASGRHAGAAAEGAQAALAD